MIVERGISLGNTFQFVVKVDNDFAQRHIIVYLHTVTGDIFLLHQFAALAQTECHDRADIVRGGNHRRTDIGFFNAVYQSGIGHAAGIVHLGHVPLLIVDIIRYVRHGGNHIHIEFAVQTFLYNLHVKQSQESATETEAQRQ